MLCCAVHQKGFTCPTKPEDPSSPFGLFQLGKLSLCFIRSFFSAGFVSPRRVLYPPRRLVYVAGLGGAHLMPRQRDTLFSRSDIDICPISKQTNKQTICAGHLTCACTFDVHSTGLPFTGDCAKFSSISENENGNDISTGCDDSTITDQTACELAGR